MLIDLHAQRRRTLERVRQSISELEDVLKQMPSEAPSRGLVTALLGRLRSNEEKLAAGLPERRVRWK